MTLLRIFMLALLLSVGGVLSSVLLLGATASFIGDPSFSSRCMDDVARSLRDSALFLDGFLGGRGE